MMRYTKAFVAASFGLLGASFAHADVIYVSNAGGNGSISQISPTTSTFASGLGDPRGMAFDNAGNLYVANFQGETISKIAPNGTTSIFATGFDGPNGMAVDTTGNLYVANYFENNVLKITSNGTVSTFGARVLDGPEGLAFDSAGNLYVANYFNNTVSEISPTGTVSTFATGLSTPRFLVVAPEPSCLALLSMFGVGLLARRR